jgi:hypothetical protein
LGVPDPACNLLRTVVDYAPPRARLGLRAREGGLEFFWDRQAKQGGPRGSVLLRSCGIIGDGEADKHKRLAVAPGLVWGVGSLGRGLRQGKPLELSFRQRLPHRLLCGRSLL